VGALTTGRRVVQNKIGTEPPTQSVWAEWPLEKVKILKFWLLGPILGHCSPLTMTPGWDILQVSDTTAKVIGQCEEWSA